MELDERLLLHVTQAPGSSAGQNGTLENSQAFLGDLKSASEAGVQQKWQQTAHFHVHRGCLGHPPLRGRLDCDLVRRDRRAAAAGVFAVVRVIFLLVERTEHPSGER